MLKWRFIGCKLLAILAWVTATAWFLWVSAATWGFIPVAMGYWSIVALPIAGFTSLWLKGLRQRVPSRGERWTIVAWLVLLLMLLPVLIAGDHPVWGHPWAQAAFMFVYWVYLVFPMAVTGWALRSIIRASSPMARGAA
jgi:hypothetical protein